MITILNPKLRKNKKKKTLKHENYHIYTARDIWEKKVNVLLLLDRIILYDYNN